jgi:hypothetical protein
MKSEAGGELSEVEIAHALMATARGLAGASVSLAMHAGSAHEGVLEHLPRGLREAAATARSLAAGLETVADMAELKAARRAADDGGSATLPGDSPPASG